MSAPLARPFLILSIESRESPIPAEVSPNRTLTSLVLTVVGAFLLFAPVSEADGSAADTGTSAVLAGTFVAEGRHFAQAARNVGQVGARFGELGRSFGVMTPAHRPIGAKRRFDADIAPMKKSGGSVIEIK